MKIQGKRDDLLRACVAAAKAVAARNVRPVLGGLHLAAGDEGLLVTGTDLEVAISTTAPCNIEEDGVAVVPARQLIEVLRRCGDGDVLIATKDSATVQVKWGHAQFTLQGYDPNEYPPVDWPTAWEPAPGVRDALRNVCFAAASSETARAMLTGVNLTQTGTLATDGFQVAYMKTDLPVTEEVILPAPNIEAVFGVFPSGDVDIARDKAGVYLRGGDTRARLRALEGKFYPVLDLVPKKWGITVKADRKAVFDALLRVSTVVEQEPPHCVIIEVKAKEIVLSSTSALGQGEESVDASVQGTKGLRLGINCKQLAEGLKALTGDQVTFCANDATTLTWWGDGGNLHFYQMPLQIQGAEKEPEKPAEPEKPETQQASA